MKTKLSLVIGFLFLTFSAAAHPLGNFSVNQYSRLEVDASTIKVRHVLDLAEIPTFQLTAGIDVDKDGRMSEQELAIYAENLTPQISEELLVTVNDVRIGLDGAVKAVVPSAGAGGLPTLRFEWELSGRFAGTGGIDRISFENRNFAERTGWNEIVAARANGLYIFDSTAFGNGLSDELRAYPQNSLDAPLNERAVRFSFSRSSPPAAAALLQDRDGRPSAPVQKDRLAELIAVPEITPAIALFGLLVACALGAMHALSPGHGKTVVGAYLVGSRGTIKHALFLGLTVTITHTLGVFALGLITLFASSYILPERLLPFLSFVSGLLVLYIGLTMFSTRLFSVLRGQSAGDRTHTHTAHDHSGPNDGLAHTHDGFTHTHDGQTHSHRPPDDITWKSLLALGISGGLLPCPSALVLMLSAISLGRTGYGLILTTAFSFGLAATLTTVGLVFLYLGKLFGGSKLAGNRLVGAIPVLSAFVIACLGAVICYNSLG